MAFLRLFKASKTEDRAAVSVDQAMKKAQATAEDDEELPSEEEAMEER